MENGNDMLAQFRRKQPQKKDMTAEMILEYEEYYMQILKQYMPEIETINEMLKELRREEQTFWEDFQKLKTAMKEDEVLSDTTKEKWFEQYHDSMAESFQLSEKLIRHYITKNLDEFEEALKNAKEKV